jgi:hypothetical protein
MKSFQGGNEKTHIFASSCLRVFQLTAGDIPTFNGFTGSIRDGNTKAGGEWRYLAKGFACQAQGLDIFVRQEGHNQ